MHILYTYKFSRGVFFVDYRNLGFSWFYFRLSTLVLHIHCDCFKKFEDLIFVDDKLPAKTAKITSLENLCIYDIQKLESKMALHFSIRIRDNK